MIKRSNSCNGAKKLRITFCCERSGQYRNTRTNEENKKEKQQGLLALRDVDVPLH